MTRDFIISKTDKRRFYKMIFDKRLVLHGGVIGEHGEDEYIITLLDEWVPYLKEYGIEYREVRKYFDKGYRLHYE